MEIDSRAKQKLFCKLWKSLQEKVQEINHIKSKSEASLENENEIISRQREYFQVMLGTETNTQEEDKLQEENQKKIA